MANTNRFTKTLLILGLFLCCIGSVFLCVFCPKQTLHPSYINQPNEAFLSLQQKYTHEIEHNILKIMEPLVGKGKIRVSVQVQLDLTNANSSTEKWSTSARQVTQHENILSKNVQNLIQQQHISVVIDGNTRNNDKEIYHARTPQEMNNFKKLIQSAVGYQPKRGDTLEIQNMPFSETPKTWNWETFHPAWYFVILCLVVTTLLIVIGFSPTDKPSSPIKELIHKLEEDALTYVVKHPVRAIAVLKNWIYMPAKEKDTDWTPIQKVGIILLALEEPLVKQILISLEDDEVRRIAKTMTSLGVIPPSESQRILTELATEMKSGSAVIGNQTRVNQIMTTSLKEKFPSTSPHTELWQELGQIDSDLLAARLQNLSPEVIACIVYHLPTQKASEILGLIPSTQSPQVLIHLNHIGHINEKTTKLLEEQAVSAARHILDTLHIQTGSEKTDEILSQLAQTQNGQNLLRNISEQSPDLAQRITEKLLRFEDISHWSIQTIQTILRHTKKQTALTALLNAPTSVTTAIKKAIPTQLWDQISQEINNMQSTPDEILTAQKNILQTAQKLLHQGKINI